MKRKPCVWFVYILRDPRNNAVRYVGATKASLGVRLSGHVKDGLSSGNAARVSWVEELGRIGLLPLIEAVETVVDEPFTRSGALVREARWIEKMLADGANLLNARNCGSALLPPEHPGRLMREMARARRLTEGAAAAEIGVAWATFGRWADGFERPRGKNREKIEVWSGGQIVASEWDRFPLVPNNRTGGRRGSILPIGALVASTA